MSKSTSSSTLSVLIGSFNIHKQNLPSNIDLSSWLIHKSHTPDLVAIGLQELPLTFTLFQQKSEHQWMKLIEKTLPNYQLLSHTRLNGLLLLIYILPSHLQHCSAICSANVPTGFFNLYGNKGAVGIRFDYHQTSLCFLNCHLSAGENGEALQQRNEQYSLIHQKMLFKPSSSPKKISDHQGIFLFGDLNYRQTKSNEDELKTQTNIHQIYSESKRTFPPTYKYKLDSNSYDLSRRSSWTDRILYRNNQCHIKPIDYWSTSCIRFSDHRPIAKLFFLSRFIR